MIRSVTFNDVVDFHGHCCPGLAYGWRMASAALKTLGISDRSADEEMVAIVENDACGIDAVQMLTGCTFGKGNLLFRDYGKMAFTLIRRDTAEAVRVRLRPDLPEQRQITVEQRVEWILNAPDTDLLICERSYPVLPEKASRRQSIPCAICKEKTMETRLVSTDDGLVCIPCSRSRSSATP